MAEEQVGDWTLPSFPPLACPLPSLCLWDGEHIDQFREFTPPALRQLLICFALQSSAQTSPNWGHRNKHHVREIVVSYSLPLGTVVASPVGRAWSRFVSTAHAVLHKSGTLPVSKHNHCLGKFELKSSWLSTNLVFSTACKVVEVCIQI